MDINQNINSLNPDQINIHENYEVEIWANKFHVTPAELKNAVNKVGISLVNVANYLKK